MPKNGLPKPSRSRPGRSGPTCRRPRVRSGKTPALAQPAVSKQGSRVVLFRNRLRELPSGISFRKACARWRDAVSGSLALAGILLRQVSPLSRSSSGELNTGCCVALGMLTSPPAFFHRQVLPHERLALPLSAKDGPKVLMCHPELLRGLADALDARAALSDLFHAPPPSSLPSPLSAPSES